jgi:hypothetical protein
VFAVGNTIYAAIQDGPGANDYGVSISTNGGTNWTNNTANGLGSTYVYGVYAVGNTVYAATREGLSISTNGGTNWTNYTTANSGLGGDEVLDVYVFDGIVYAATIPNYDPNDVTVPTSSGGLSMAASTLLL